MLVLDYQQINPSLLLYATGSSFAYQDGTAFGMCKYRVLLVLQYDDFSELDYSSRTSILILLLLPTRANTQHSNEGK